jgi:hypothetical protein
MWHSGFSEACALSVLRILLIIAAEKAKCRTLLPADDDQTTGCTATFRNLAETMLYDAAFDLEP